MKKYLITVNQNQFEVEVVEIRANSTATPQPRKSPVAKQETLVATPAPAQAARKAGVGNVTAPMPGTVISLFAKPGEPVKKGQKLLVFEAMKMENELTSPVDGVVSEIKTSVGKNIVTGELLIVLS